MKFSILAAAAALVTVVAAKAVFTNSEFVVTQGEPFTLTWSNATGSSTITLKDGVSTDLQTVLTVASGVTGSSYTWTPPATLASGSYAFEIVDGSGIPNYSVFFSYVGAAVSSSSSSATTVTSTTSGSTSTTASTTASSGSTTQSSTSTSSSSSSKTSSTSASTSTPANTNNGQRLGSSLALVLVAAAALMCFN